MGIRPAVLILAAGLLFWSAADAFAGRIACLQCHERHYEEIGSCTSCHRGDERSDRLAIAHRELILAKYSWFTLAGSKPVQRGKKLLDSFACQRCHTASGKGNRLASNLDRLSTDTTPQKIFDAIESQALFMPEFYLKEQQILDLVNALLAGAAKTEKKGGEVPQVIRFEDVKQNRENAYEKRCGSCHKVLTISFGALGKGEIGPNLSGLFSQFYPSTFPGNRKWTDARMRKWLRNPRQLRPITAMKPISLERTEVEEILRILH